MLMFFKRARIVTAGTIATIVFYCTVLGATSGVVAGVLLTHYLYDKHHVPKLAFQQAREAVESDMRAACGNWFTDSRSKGNPAGRIVVCRAPDFLSNPLPSVE